MGTEALLSIGETLIQNARKPQGGMEFHAGEAIRNRQFDSVYGVPI